MCVNEGTGETKTGARKNGEGNKKNREKERSWIALCLVSLVRVNIALKSPDNSDKGVYKIDHQSIYESKAISGRSCTSDVILWSNG